MREDPADEGAENEETCGQGKGRGLQLEKKEDPADSKNLKHQKRGGKNLFF
jgi:hypothetical protein